MRIEIEIDALTLESLRGLVAQVERAGGGPDAVIAFTRRRKDGGFVACAEFVPMAFPVSAMGTFRLDERVWPLAMKADERTEREIEEQRNAIAMTSEAR